MFYYLARVELQGYTTPKDYENLHEAMSKKGFLRTITDSNNTFHLPIGEYVWATKEDKLSGTVREELRAIILAIHSNYLVIVAKAKDSDVSWWLTKA